MRATSVLTPPYQFLLLHTWVCVPASVAAYSISSGLCVVTVFIPRVCHFSSLNPVWTFLKKRSWKVHPFLFLLGGPHVRTWLVASSSNKEVSESCLLLDSAEGNSLCRGHACNFGDNGRLLWGEPGGPPLAASSVAAWPPCMRVFFYSCLIPKKCSGSWEWPAKALGCLSLPGGLTVPPGLPK